MKFRTDHECTTRRLGRTTRHYLDRYTDANPQMAGADQKTAQLSSENPTARTAGRPVGLARPKSAAALFGALLLLNFSSRPVHLKSDITLQLIDCNVRDRSRYSEHP